MDDIAIIGGGVAGLAAARALQQRGRAPLRIAPARTHPRNRGELLGPRAATSLTTLAWRHLLDDARMALPADARYSAWGGPALVRAPGVPELGSGWYIDRAALEAAMRAEVDTGPGRHIDAAIAGCTGEGAGWRLTLSTGETIGARFVIDASGRGCAIARRLGGQRRRATALVAMHQTLAVPGSDLLSASLIESAPDGWWYTSPVPGGGRVFIAYFTDADLLPGAAGGGADIVASLLATAPLTRARLESLDAVVPASPWRVDVASTARQERVAGDGWAASGDAAVALDPLSGHGLTVALWSAIQATGAADAWLKGEPGPLHAYQRAVDAGMRRFVADADRHYRAERRFAERPFWSRRQHAPAGEADADRSRDDVEPE